MRKAIQLSIPEPCHENWNAMSPQDKGRHCAACEKTVVDFTHKTDEHIIKHLESEKNICGRFKGSQIDRELAYSRKDANDLLHYVASGLLVFLAWHPVQSNAQQTPTPVTLSAINNNQIQGKVAVSILKERVISGTVLDENNLPLPGVTVTIKGKSVGVLTDFEGHYKLKVEKGDVLEFRFIGYNTMELIVNQDSVYNISFEDQVELMGGIVICEFSNGTPILSPEDIKENQRLDSIRKDNHKKFYNRLFQEKIEAKKIERKQRQLNRKKK